MYRIIITIFLLFTLGSCAREELPAGLRAGGFKLASEQKLAEVLKEISSLYVPYEVNEKGWVIYMQKDKATVLGILRKAHYGNELSARVIESEVVMDSAHLQLLVSRFEEQGIPYNVETFNDVEQISWLQIYGPKVDIIIQEVGFERTKTFNKQIIQH